jgi:histidinol dehydrogenase
MLRLNSRDPGFAAAFKQLVADRRESGADLARDVEAILGEVKTRGDAALADMTARWDQHALASDVDWQFSASQCREAFAALKPDLRAALYVAAAGFRAFN